MGAPPYEIDRISSKAWHANLLQTLGFQFFSEMGGGSMLQYDTSAKNSISLSNIALYPHYHPDNGIIQFLAKFLLLI